MDSVRASLVVLILGMVVTIGVGCSDVCDSFCAATVDKIETMGCMSSDEWNTSWTSLGWEDSQDWLEFCQDTYAAQLKDAKEESGDAAGEIRQTCSDKLDETEAAESCDDISVAGY